MATTPKKRTNRTSTAKTSKPGTSKRKTASRSASKSKTANTKTTTPRRSSTKSTAKTPQKEILPQVDFSWSGLSPDRKMDIIGILTSVVGLLTAVSLFSNGTSAATGWWAGALYNSVGWGAILLALGLIGLGLWMIFRNSDKLPQLSPERFLGILLVFVNLTVWINLFSGAGWEKDSAVIGGGFIGAAFEHFLVAGLGTSAAVIALLGWLLIGLILTLDLALLDLFRWVSNLFSRFQSPQSSRPQANIAVDEEGEYEKIMPDVEESEKDLPNTFVPMRDLNQPEAAVQTNSRKSRGKPQEQQKQPDNQPERKPETVPPVKPPKTIWALPKAEEILDPPSPVSVQENIEQETAKLIEETLSSFGVPGHVVDIKQGPTVTQYGLEPDFIETRHGRTRVRVNKITSLADDLALALAAARIRIQAPVPGKSYVGIEVPNKETSRVTLLEILKNTKSKSAASPLVFGLGKNVSGKPITVDLTRLPHLLIAGTTGSGKSVCVNSILTSFLINNTPDNLKLVLVDPKRVELTGYNGIPHLLSPTVTDAEKVINALQWMTREMDSRYHKFSKIGVRNIVEYNTRNGNEHLPYIVVVIDELADLMMLAPDETERTITRLAQLARATGIHLILATQRPSTDVVTGLIKANFPARIAFAVASGVDSRVILDQPGAERLLGRGDMLFQAPDASAPERLQGVFVSDNEIQKLVNYWKEATNNLQFEQKPNDELIDLPRGVPLKQELLFEESPEDGDKLLPEAIDLVRREGRASITMLQRRLRIGYTRAARIIDMMEEKGIVSGVLAHTNVREVLDYGPAAPPKED